MILRCTAKMLVFLGVRARDLADAPPADNDSYVKLFGGRPPEVPPAHHAGTLFRVFVAEVRKSDICPIGPYVMGLVEQHLRSEGLARGTLGQLVAEEVQLAKTVSRSILAP